MVSQQGVENIVINIFLLVIYILLFGRPSIEKYLHKGVIILTHEEHPPTITPPGNVFEESQDSCNSVPTITVINIIPLNWELTEKAFCDEGQNGEDFIKCIEEKAPWALSKSEVITDTTTQIKVQPYFLTTFFELVQSLDIEAGKIKKSPFSDPLKITLNSTKPYYVVITDSKLALVNANPDVLPRSFLILNPYSGVEVLAYMKVRTQNYQKIPKMVSMPGNKTREAESARQSVRGVPRVQLRPVCGAQHHGRRGLPAALEKVLPS